MKRDRIEQRKIQKRNRWQEAEGDIATVKVLKVLGNGTKIICSLEKESLVLRFKRYLKRRLSGEIYERK